MPNEFRLAVNVFAGRVGGNQEFIINRNDHENASLLEAVPDAAPVIPFRQLFDLRGLRNLSLWKQAFVEGIGSFILVYSTGYINLSHNDPPPLPSPKSGPFSTTTFLGPLIGGITNAIIITIAIYCFGPLTGGHLNPFLTIATLLIRLTSLPRAIIYISFQLAGSALAGLLISASYGSSNFKVGGCYLFPPATTGNALAAEFGASLTLIILATGVSIDPRNRVLLGPALSPFLVGLTLGTLSFGFSFATPGYGGPSLNPARCFGVYIGSAFPGWHWVHWLGPMTAAIAHAIMYATLPPWELHGRMEELQGPDGSQVLCPHSENAIRTSAADVLDKTENKV